MTEEAIFAEALKKKPDERGAYLQEACGGNAGLRAAVESLLAASAAAGSFLEHPVVGAEATVVAELASNAMARSGAQEVVIPLLEECHKPDRIGKLDTYEVIEVVGQGGMGAVLRAFDTKLCRVVAVKVMSPALASNPTAVVRFLREATAGAAVHHDHVVTIHAVNDVHKPPYLVMEFIEGQTLEQKIERQGALELTHVLRIGSQAAAGLAAAHKTGLIHRDIKPSNILLENGIERVKISDFGLARAVDDVNITQTGVIAGTPQYMSPEQAKGDVVDARSDLFSLGSVLYTMCTGRPAFRADSTVAVLRRVCDDAPRPVREVAPQIPDWLESIIYRLLAKNPAERYQTAAEVADLLARCLAHVQNPTQYALPGELTGSSSLRTVEPKPLISKTPARNDSRFRTAAIAATALALLLVILTFTEASGVTALSATVVRIAAGEGRLIIESSDPGMKVAINGEEVTIQGAGIEEIRLRPGSYQLAAMKDGKRGQVDQELVTITRGGTQVVRVSLDRDLTPERPASPERAAATLESPAVTTVAWHPPENPDPGVIRQEAQKDMQARRYEVALAKLSWYHENALVYQPSQSGVRLSFAMGDWLKLADAYSPALEKLKSYRDTAMAEVLAGRKVFESFHDLVAINRTLRENHRTRDLFLQLHAQSPQDAKRVFSIAQPALIQHKEYKLCLEYLEPDAAFDRMVANFRRNEEFAKKSNLDKKLLQFGENKFTSDVTTLVALLVVNGQKSEAERIAGLAKKEWNNSRFKSKLDRALEGHVPEPWPGS